VAKGNFHMTTTCFIFYKNIDSTEGVYFQGLLPHISSGHKSVTSILRVPASAIFLGGNE
jgi:hypothetical protein